MPRKYIRVAELTPEQLLKRRVRNKVKYKSRHKKCTSERYKEILARNAAWSRANRKRKPLTEKELEAKRIYDRKKRETKAPLYTFKGSVVASSVPSSGRDLLLSLMASVPRCDDREDIISEAALLMLEGVSQSEAIETARKRVRKNVWQLRNSKQIEACFWL